MKMKIFNKGELLHVVHCFMLLGIITFSINAKYGHIDIYEDAEKFENNNYIVIIIIFSIRFIMTYLLLFNLLLSTFGLILYNCFENEVTPAIAPNLAPFTCFRVVTKGEFPNLVIENVERNKKLCIETGLTNFIIQVVTDKELPLPNDDKYVMQTVVPSNYQPKNGVKYKGRALQYALDDPNITFSDTDWIVHLDEESQLTKNSIYGIINFISSGKYDIGEGLVCYSAKRNTSWLTNLMDNLRIADDMGRLRFQLRGLHRLLSEWKGSFIVTQVQTEKDVSFDGGSDASLTEDIFFGLKAASKGYTFDFIDGEIWELSPFTFCDAIKQRKRWFQGGERVARTTQIPFLSKLLLFLNIYVGILAMLFFIFTIDIIYPLPKKLIRYYDIAMLLNGIIIGYMHVFGLIKSYSLKRSYNLPKLIIYILLTPVVAASNFLVSFVVIWWVLVKRDKQFNVIKKEVEMSIVILK